MANRLFQQKIGCVEIRDMGKYEQIPGETIKGIKNSTGKMRIFQIKKSDDWIAKAGFIVWDNGEMEARITSIDGKSREPQLSLLENKLRLEIQEHDDKHYRNALKQARLKSPSPAFWANLFKASIEELDEGARIDTVSILNQYNTTVSYKKEFDKNISENHNLVYAIYLKDAIHVPIICLTISRLLPIYYCVEANSKN